MEDNTNHILQWKPPLYPWVMGRLSTAISQFQNSKIFIELLISQLSACLSPPTTQKASIQGQFHLGVHKHPHKIRPMPHLGLYFPPCTPIHQCPNQRPYPVTWHFYSEQCLHLWRHLLVPSIIHSYWGPCVESAATSLRQATLPVTRALWIPPCWGNRNRNRRTGTGTRMGGISHWG